MTGSVPQPVAAEAVAETPVAASPAVAEELTPRQRFDRRRRRVNLGVLAMLALFCLLFYAISMVKLAHYGLAWIE